jgi:hypothetical protein
VVDWDREIEALVRDSLSERRTQPPPVMAPPTLTLFRTFRDEIGWEVRKEITERVEAFRLQQQRFARERKDFADAVLKSISDEPIT